MRSSIVKVGLVMYGSLDTISGGYLYDRMLVSHLRGQGDQVDVISLPAGAYAAHLLQNLWFRLDGAWDILLQDELCHPSLLAQNARRRSSPVIGIVHNLSSEGTRPQAGQQALRRLVEREYLRGLDGYIFNSSTTREAVLALHGAAKPHVIASPGGDRLGESSLDAIEARAKESGPLRLLFLANVVPGKGLDVVLRALQELPAADYQLDVIGSCDAESLYARRMQSRAAAASLPVHFRGPLDGRALADVLQHSHVLVLPSYYEGYGIAFLEGMAHGLPALGTTAGAMPEVISHGENGFLVRPGDSAALARHLKTLASDRSLLARMGTKAFQKYRSSPTWRQTTARIREFLVETIERGQSAGSQG